MKKRHSNGFTLTELLITIAVFLLITGAVYAGFLLSQKAYRASELASELSQNGRVVLERITREVRQAKEIATELSEEEPVEAVNPLNGIIFEDGHGTTTYYYIHYFKEDSSLRREVLGYYFSDNPGVYVPWDAVPPGSQTLETETLEDPKTVGEYITGIKFWGTKVINISLVLEKKQKTVELDTKIFGRNL